MDSAASPAPKAGEKSRQTTGESIKETLESILIAFILAFVFRAYAVEAFVIPTGSMAPTLLGAHMRFRCEDCGREFDANFPAGSQGGDPLIPSVSGEATVFSIACENCGYKVPAEPGKARNTPVRYGDRILVLKYLYLLQEPQRWDVVVFKSPADDEPQKPDKYSVNYIKRLVGRPGEELMILDGDIYVRPVRETETRRKAEGWQIQAKPYVAQEAMWRLVYDNDFLPKRESFKQPWQEKSPKSGWQAAGRSFAFKNADGSGTLAFNKDANADLQWYPLTDWLAYDQTRDQIQLLGMDNSRAVPYADGPTQRGHYVPRWYVSDVKVAFDYERKSGDGTLSALLTKLDDRYRAEIGANTVRVLHSRNGGREEPVGPDVPLPARAGRSLRVEFANVDRQVTLRIDGQLLVKTDRMLDEDDFKGLLERNEQRRQLSDSRRSPEEIRQVFPPPRVEISAEKQECQVSHLSLWRDTYYTPAVNTYADWIRLSGPDNPVRLGRAGMTIDGRRVQEDEFFVCGDNSPMSYDARGWLRDVNLRDSGEDLYVAAGRVPARFMIGKAFFVYWPAGFRPFGPSFPGIVPNFGNMRFIH